MMGLDVLRSIWETWVAPRKGLFNKIGGFHASASPLNLCHFYADLISYMPCLSLRPQSFVSIAILWAGDMVQRGGSRGLYRMPFSNFCFVDVLEEMEARPRCSYVRAGRSCWYLIGRWCRSFPERFMPGIDAVWSMRGWIYFNTTSYPLRCRRERISLMTLPSASNINKSLRSIFHWSPF